MGNFQSDIQATSYSFSGWLFGCFLLMIFPTTFLYLLTSFMLPLSTSLMTFWEVLIIRFFVILIPIQISIQYLLWTLPFQPIDWSRAGIIKSAKHIVFYILSLPILGVFIFITFILYRSSSLYIPDEFGILAMTVFVIFPTIVWFFITIHASELFFGKNYSQTLNMRRSIKPRHTMIANKYAKKQMTRRWAIISFSSYYIITLAGNFFIGPNDSFMGASSLLIGSNLMFFLLILPLNRFWFQNKNGHFFNNLNNFYIHVFGERDISSNAAQSGGLGAFFIYIIAYIFGVDVPFPESILFVGLDILCIAIVIVTIWNNQFKEFLDNRKVATKNST